MAEVRERAADRRRGEATLREHSTPPTVRNLALDDKDRPGIGFESSLRPRDRPKKQEAGASLFDDCEPGDGEEEK